MAEYKYFTNEELTSKILELEGINKSLNDKISDLENKQQQNLLATESNRLHNSYTGALLNSIPDALSIISYNGNINYILSSERSIFGKGEIEGCNIKEIFPIDVYQNILQCLDRVLKTKKIETTCFSLTIDNNLNFFESRISYIDNKNALCICRNITNQTSNQKKLEFSSSRMMRVERAASISLWYYYTATNEIQMPAIIPTLIGKGRNSDRCTIDEYLKYVTALNCNSQKFFLPEAKNNNFCEHQILINGERRYLQTHIIGEYENEQGGGKIIEGYVQDVTSIVKPMHELEMVKYAVNNSHEEIYACKVDGTIILVNNKFAKHHNIIKPICEYEPKIYELENLNISQDIWEGYVERLLADKLPQKNIISKIINGEQKLFEAVSYSIKDDLGEDIIWSFSTDITLRIESEKKINDLNIVMDVILNNVPACLFVKDTGDDFRYLYWNKACSEYVNMPQGFAIGKTDYEVYSEDADRFRECDLDLLNNKETTIRYMENYTDTNGVYRTTSTIKSIIKLEGDRKPWLVGISWDVTELKKVENELVRSKENAIESNRLKSAFLANMSHEIRTPLNAIVGFSKLIAETEDEEDKREFSKIIDSNSGLLMQLINDILDLSKIEAGTLDFIDKKVTINSLCKEIQSMLSMRVKDGVELIFEKSPEVTLVCDGNRLAQVISNFITNAIKFTFKGDIRFGYKKINNKIEFYVKDTGSGIPQDKISEVFERFKKLNSNVNGTGLGLSICKMIVERFGGDIWATSEEGKGSTFFFTIPINDVIEDIKSIDGDENCIDNDISANDINEFNDNRDKKKILIVEDDESNFQLVNLVLKNDYKILRATNGLEAIIAYIENSVDLIIMDILMPEMDGLEATREIRNLTKDTPIIALTSLVLDSDKQAAFDAGCNAFISKPIDINDFATTIHSFFIESDLQN